MEVTTAERYASGGPGKKPEHSNVYEAFTATVERIGEDVALRTEDDSVSLTWKELSAWVSRIAGGLEALGLQKGETVALMLNNRPEFIPCDLAVVCLGGVPFSIYQTSSPEQIAYVVGDAGSRIAIVESAFLETFNEARKEPPGDRARDRDRRRGRDRDARGPGGRRTRASTPPSAPPRSASTTFSR